MLSSFILHINLAKYLLHISLTHYLSCTHALLFLKSFYIYKLILKIQLLICLQCVVLNFLSRLIFLKSFTFYRFEYIYKTKLD